MVIRLNCSVLLCEIYKLKCKGPLKTRCVFVTRWVPDAAAPFHSLHPCGPALHLCSVLQFTKSVKLVPAAVPLHSLTLLE